MITKFELGQEAEAFAIPEPRHITIGLHDIAVRTGEHNPDLPLPSRIASAIAKTYSDVDGVYAKAVGMREPEYRDAEAAARAYKAAGYAGDVSPYISGWAGTQGITNAIAADAIIAKADALAGAKILLRNTRFTTQSAMNAAQTSGELMAAIAAWDSFITAVKSQV